METNNELNGIINVLKPPGMTSHDVVSYLRRSLRIKKTGHTGTLDPGVAGVLPVCLGKATKIIEYMGDDIKRYRAEVTFGRTTDTQDGFGQTLSVCDASDLSFEKAAEALQAMQGPLQQIPPMVSAVKHKGRKLYELARAGIEVEREPRSIHIYEIKIIKSAGFGQPNPTMLFDIKCSKGTYVRTICHDLGQALGYGGVMSFLVRTGTGRFHIDNALTLEEIATLIERGEVTGNIMPLEHAIPYEAVWICDQAVVPVMHGNRINSSVIEKAPHILENNQMVKLMNNMAGCLAVARVTRETPFREGQDGSEVRYLFQPVKVFC